MILSCTELLGLFSQFFHLTLMLAMGRQKKGEMVSQFGLLILNLCTVMQMLCNSSEVNLSCNGASYLDYIIILGWEWGSYYQLDIYFFLLAGWFWMVPPHRPSTLAGHLKCSFGSLTLQNFQWPKRQLMSFYQLIFCWELYKWSHSGLFSILDQSQIAKLVQKHLWQTPFVLAAHTSGKSAK